MDSHIWKSVAMVENKLQHYTTNYIFLKFIQTFRYGSSQHNNNTENNNIILPLGILLNAGPQRKVT